METYGCIDNCLDQLMYEDLIQISNLSPYLSGNRIEPEMPDVIRWLYGQDTDIDGPGVYFNDSCRNNPQLVYEIFFNKNLSSRSPSCNFYLKLTQYILKNHFSHHKIDRWEVIRMKINLGLKTTNRKRYLVPHLDDVNGYHLSMSLFLGQSDGDHTVFRETDPNIRKKQDKDLTILDQFNYQNNRLVYNFGHYHCNYDPVQHDHRLALNIVLKLS